MAYHLNTEHNHSPSHPSSADRKEHSSDEIGTAAKWPLQTSIVDGG